MVYKTDSETLSAQKLSAQNFSVCLSVCLSVCPIRVTQWSPTDNLFRNGCAQAACIRSKPSRRRSSWSKAHLMGFPVCGVTSVDFQHPTKWGEYLETHHVLRLRSTSQTDPENLTTSLSDCSMRVTLWSPTEKSFRNDYAHATRIKSKPSRRRSPWPKPLLIGCPVCGYQS